MSKKPKDETPDESCLYCEHDVPCIWTVRVGACTYPLCKDCTDEARHDNFSYSMRKPEDRKSKDDSERADGS